MNFIYSSWQLSIFQVGIPNIFLFLCLNKWTSKKGSISFELTLRNEPDLYLAINLTLLLTKGIACVKIQMTMG